jgi:hypothetical protein
MRNVDQVAQRAHPAFGLARGAAHAVGPARNTCAHGRLRALARVERNHATRRAAVERSEWPANHFDALGTAQRKVGRLPLPIRGRGWNAIDEQTHAAHAERGARTVAAHRNLQILRVVLPVQHHESRHTPQAFGEIDLQRVGADLIAFDDVQRGWRVPACTLCRTAGDHHRLQQAFGAVCRFLVRRSVLGRGSCDPPKYAACAESAGQTPDTRT